jgi:hypothetical protein
MLRTTAAAAVVAAMLTAATSPAAEARPHAKGAYEVGLASRSINPGADGTFAGKPVYLGGYGIASPPLATGRPATGILGDGVSVRAMVVGDGRHLLAIADAELQGWFAATKDGPYGIVDVRREVERRTNGALRASRVVVQSDHSHSAPDLLGVWGGAPAAYRAHVVEQTVAAIVDAYRHRRRGSLWYGTAPGADLLSNQFGYDPANEAVDSEMRVLQARDRRGKPFATLLNFSAHATVLGADNTKASGDWVQVANPLLERRFGGAAMTVVGTLGRTQPADRGCADTTARGDALQLCKLDGYAWRVVDRAAQAVAHARPLRGRARVGAESFLVEDVGSNPLLLGLLYGGQAVGAPLNRSQTPPYLTGAVVGTVTASARIGDVLLSAGPGEMYPQIPLKVRSAVGGLRGYLTAGLADDQLGYLIAPFEAYPEPVRRSLFTQRGDQLSPVDNDNYLFNVSHTMGERVTCSLLRGAGDLFGRGQAPRDGYDRCAAFANDMAVGPGADTQPGV